MPYQQITIRDHSSESNLFTRRAFFAFIFVIILILVLLSNLYHLQVEKHETYKTRSNDNRISVRPIAPNRGLIFDRNGILLAENRSTYSLDVVLEKSGKPDKWLKRLADLLVLDDDLQKKFSKKLKRTSRFKSLTL
ncbi:MAG: penicillin-binding protein 2, partial [Psychrosphaera sp.]|nr:penicillin-binding protein 2 [Psychrosphaera sp.]